LNLSLCAQGSKSTKKINLQRRAALAAAASLANGDELAGRRDQAFGAER
jgi:hypothetical protein